MIRDTITANLPFESEGRKQSIVATRRDISVPLPWKSRGRTSKTVLVSDVCYDWMDGIMDGLIPWSGFLQGLKKS